MIPDNNPFRPSFGASPTKLVGRSYELSSFSYGLFGGVGSMHRVLLVTGGRGFGKTVLLNEFEDTARQQGWIVLRAYANEQLIDELRDSTIPIALTTLDHHKTPSTRHVTGISISGLDSISTQHTAPTPPAPTLISSLRELARAAKAHQTGILITLDEMQAAPPEALAELATAIQDLIRDDYDIAFAAAGLTFGIETLLDHPGTTFMRRAHRIDLKFLEDDTVSNALEETAKTAGRSFTPEALTEAIHLIQGYPYLLQLTGALAWMRATLDGSDVIKLEHVHPIREEIVQFMGNQVHKIALKQVPDAQIEFLHAMVTVLQSGENLAADVPTSKIAQVLGKQPNGISMARRALIERDLITTEKYGTVRFSLPYLGEYLQTLF